MSDGVPSGHSWHKKLTDWGMPRELVDLLESCFEDDVDERPAEAAQLAILLKRILNPATVKSQCPQCKTVLKIQANVKIGAKLRCPKCAHIFTHSLSEKPSTLSDVSGHLMGPEKTLKPVAAPTVGSVRSAALSNEQITCAVNVMREFLQAPAKQEGKTPYHLSAEGDKKRVELIDGPLKPLLEGYMAGSVPLDEFKSKIDGINKRNENWGFKGIKGQMFFNMVVNVAPDSVECDREIKAAIMAPINEETARSRIQAFESYVRRIGDTHVGEGGKKQGRPNPGSIPFFLSYFWQIQDRRTWPVYYTNSVNKMLELNLWQPTEDLAENYITYKHIHEELAAAFTKASGRPFDLYDVEHVFWFRGGNPYDIAKSSQEEDKSDDEQEGAAWSGYWFVNVGEGVYRNWDDCRKFGFLAAGQGFKYSNALKKLNVGDKVFAYMKSLGYVGFGEVVSEAVMAKDFALDGGELLFENPLIHPGMKTNSGDPNMSEWVVGIRWSKTFPRDEARKFQGAFANQNIVCKLRDQPTLDFLKQEFSVEELDGDQESPERFILRDKVGVDSLGCRLGSQAAAINRVLTNKPQKVEKIAKESGLSVARVRDHLRYHLKKKNVKESDEGWSLA
jgi:hypothetical protein